MLCSAMLRLWRGWGRMGRGLGRRFSRYVMHPEGLEYRRLEKRDLPAVYQMAPMLESRDFVLDDLKRVSCHATDYSTVAVTPSGEVIGYLGQVRPDRFSQCLHSLMVRPDWQGRGVAKELVGQALSNVKLVHWALPLFMDERNLNAYGHSFHFTPEEYSKFYSCRMLVKREEMEKPPFQPLTSDVKIVTFFDGRLVDQIYQYDTAVRNGFPRDPRFFCDIILGGDGVCIAVAIDKLKRVVGYGVSRPHQEPEVFTRVGPLYADSEEVFVAILRRLLEPLEEGAVVRLCVAAHNFDTMHLLYRFPVTGFTRHCTLLWPDAGRGREPKTWDKNAVFIVSSVQAFDMI